jgi:hypothetical protein
LGEARQVALLDRSHEGLCYRIAGQRPREVDDDLVVAQIITLVGENDSPIDKQTVLRHRIQ